jgi:hypothetical protein
MRWMVIYGYGVPGGDLNLNSTNYPDHGHHGDPPLSGKNSLGRARNRTWDLMISSQKHWPLDHEGGHTGQLHVTFIGLYKDWHRTYWFHFIHWELKSVCFPSITEQCHFKNNVCFLTLSPCWQRCTVLHVSYWLALTFLLRDAPF